MHRKTLAALPLILGLAWAGIAATKKNEGPETREGRTAEDLPDFDYEFGRPVRPDEKTYAWYRKTHAEEAAKRMNVDAASVADGMDTWHWWVGVDNPGFWRDMAKLTGSRWNKTHLRIDFFQLLITTPRAERFKRLGLINDPDAVAAEKPDQFGLMLDRMKDGTLTWDPEKFGYSSGVIGLQLFKNPKFDAKKWDLKKYVDDPGSVEPPYNVGMSCAICHVGFDPLHPPADPAEPTWENITSAIGNQYLREGMIFGQNLEPSSLIYQYLNTQEPGTSETSRFPYDGINNPTHINSIYRLATRLKLAREEKITPDQKKLIESMYKNAGVPLDSPIGALGGTATEPTLKVPHVLADGADSMGVLTASVRVYVNEGMMYKEWYDSLPINPFHILGSIKRNFTQREFDIMGKARQDPNSPWMQTERRMPNMALFLSTYDSFPLPKNHLSQDKALLKRGKIVFADTCASCHSSKVPKKNDQAGWRELVQKDDFLVDNYLADDQRHSVLELGTNAQRAEGSNAQAGSTWGQMSSQTYKDMRAVPMELKNLYNPITKNYDINWTGPSAYYRTPTLVSIWATAPYLHNNSVGVFTDDPSIEARIKAFEESMLKLLTPDQRRGIGSIKVTSQETSLPELFPDLVKHLKLLDGMTLKIMSFPAGTPINLLMNLNPKHFPALAEAYIQGVLHGEPRTKFKSLINRRRDAGMAAMIQKMIELNTCPDFIEDKGHTYGSELSAADKKALIEYMKYF